MEVKVAVFCIIGERHHQSEAKIGCIRAGKIVRYYVDVHCT